MRLIRILRGKIMNKPFFYSLALFGLVIGGVTACKNNTEQTPAAIAVNSIAPDFSTYGALAGQAFNFTLSEKLKSGPVVLYFFPKAFTPGCTAEAHEFAEKTEEFRALGATIIGMSADNAQDLARFSKEECRDKFAVAHADAKTIADYGVKFDLKPELTNRTSFVIAQNGTIKLIYSNLDFREHVSRTLEAVRELKANP